MRIWRKGVDLLYPREDVMVQPGTQHPETSDFFDKDGKPILFNVIFKYGQTDELPDNLARFVIDQGFAQETRFILPGR